jgi:hypothetical protein
LRTSVQLTEQVKTNKTDVSSVEGATACEVTKRVGSTDSDGRNAGCTIDNYFNIYNIAGHENERLGADTDGSNPVTPEVTASAQTRSSAGGDTEELADDSGNRSEKLSRLVDQLTQYSSEQTDASALNTTRTLNEIVEVRVTRL